MSVSHSNNDLEAQFIRALNTGLGHAITQVSVQEDSIAIYASGKSEDSKHLRIEIKAPWRIIEKDEILVGSLDVQRAGSHRLRKTDVENRCRKLLGKKLTSFDLLDFSLNFEDDILLEHFATATSDDECFVTLDDKVQTNTAFRLGFGWIEPK